MKLFSFLPLQGFLFVNKRKKQQVCGSEWPGSSSFQRYGYPDSIRELNQVCVIGTLQVASSQVLTAEMPEPLSLFHSELQSSRSHALLQAGWAALQMILQCYDSPESHYSERLPITRLLPVCVK